MVSLFCFLFFFIFLDIQMSLVICTLRLRWRLRFSWRPSHPPPAAHVSRNTHVLLMKARKRTFTAVTASRSRYSHLSVALVYCLLHLPTSTFTLHLQSPFSYPGKAALSTAFPCAPTPVTPLSAAADQSPGGGPPATAEAAAMWRDVGFCREATRGEKRRLLTPLTTHTHTPTSVSQKVLKASF